MEEKSLQQKVMSDKKNTFKHMFIMIVLKWHHVYEERYANLF